MMNGLTAPPSYTDSPVHVHRVSYRCKLRRASLDVRASKHSPKESRCSPPKGTSRQGKNEKRQTSTSAAADNIITDLQTAVEVRGKHTLAHTHRTVLLPQAHPARTSTNTSLFTRRISFLPSPKRTRNSAFPSPLLPSQPKEGRRSVQCCMCR